MGLRTREKETARGAAQPAKPVLYMPQQLSFWKIPAIMPKTKTNTDQAHRDQHNQPRAARCQPCVSKRTENRQPGSPRTRRAREEHGKEEVRGKRFFLLFFLFRLGEEDAEEGIPERCSFAFLSARCCAHHGSSCAPSSSPPPLSSSPPLPPSACGGGRRGPWSRGRRRPQAEARPTTGHHPQPCRTGLRPPVAARAPQRHPVAVHPRS